MPVAFPRNRAGCMLIELSAGSHLRRRSGQVGFTLIELLVVITIIVLLLSLLAPALDAAMYQTELSVCGTNQKTISNGVTMYAAEQKRYYPHRAAVSTPGQPTQLRDPWGGGDDRPILGQYIALQAFMDPLCDVLKIDPGSTRSYKKNGQDTPEPFVIAGYNMFFGFGYVGFSKMSKIGQRFNYTGSTLFDPAANVSRSFDILLCDQNDMTRNTQGYTASHPDSAGYLPLQTLNNEPVEPGPGGLTVLEGFYYVMSRYAIAGASERRGTLDLNNAYADGSVSRMNDVPWDEEELVTSAPVANDGPGPYDYWINLPRTR